MWTTLENMEDISIIEQLMHINYFSAAYCTYYDFKRSDSLQIKIISALSFISFIQFSDNKRDATCEKGYSSFGSISSALLPTRNSSHHELYSW
jgi:hypothetical protein